MDKDFLFGERDPAETKRLSTVVRKFKRDGSYWGEYNLDDERDGRIVCLRPEKVSFRHYKRGVQHGRSLTIRKNNGVVTIQNVQDGVLENSHVSVY